MKIIIPNVRLKSFLALTRHTLFAAAILTLAYCTFVLVDAWAFQDRESADFDRQVQIQRQSNLKTANFTQNNRGLIGRIEIQRLGLEAIVIEGTSRSTLRRAVGHIAGTALPGEIGNIGISGHRDTFFRPLRNIRKDDIITLTTLSGEFRYRVVSTRIVTPLAIEVLNSGKDEVLTLVTCYPFYFLGSAPDRFIVRAERVS